MLPLYSKVELERCKEAELEEQRRSFGTEHEQKERGYTEKMSQLTAQLQQLDAVVAQVLNAQCTPIGYYFTLTSVNRLL